MNYHIGKEGFVWFLGVVEDRQDPEKLGRVRVRCFGWHTEDTSAIPTESLPWAQTIVSPNLPATYTPKEGDWVTGFFMDGESAQHPVIMGVLYGYPVQHASKNNGFADPNGVYPKRINEPTTNRLARGRIDGTIHEIRNRNLLKDVQCAGGVSWSEPSPTFAPEYPYNYAHESESGHAFELDDTTGKERVNLSHKNGSFIEMDATGNRVEKVVKDSYTVIMGDDYVAIEGNCNITVNGNCNLKVKEKINIEAESINMSAKSDIRIKAGGVLKTESGSSTDIGAGGAMTVGGGGKLSLKGADAHLEGNKVNLSGSIANKVKTPHGIGKILPSGGATSPSSTGLETPK